MSNKKSSLPPQLADGALEFTLTVDKSKVAKAKQRALESLAKNVEIKGFRKGKAPLALVETALSQSKLYAKILELVLPSAYAAAVKKNHYQPLLEPRITPITMERGKDWKFKVQTAEAPQVKLGNYRRYLKSALAKASREEKSRPDKDNKGNKNQDRKLRTVFDTILEHAQVNPAPLLVQKEASSALRKLEAQLAPLKITLEQYLRSIKKTRAELEQEYTQTALNNLRLEFALKAIVESEKPAISTQEITQLKPTAKQEPYLKYQLQKRKVLDMLVEL